MANAVTVYTTAKVLPGKRVEVETPELSEGAEVDVFVVARTQRQTKKSILDIADARLPSQLTTEDWKRIETEFQAERESWDR